MAEDWLSELKAGDKVDSFVVSSRYRKGCNSGNEGSDFHRVIGIPEKWPRGQAQVWIYPRTSNSRSGAGNRT